MKTFLFYDTETTGLAKMNLPPEHPSQPRIVQIAALLTDDKGREMMSLNSYVKPHGFIIPAEAAAIHGITTEMAKEKGLDSEIIIEMFYHFGYMSDIHVCHNIAFDSIVVKHEASVHSLVLVPRPQVCTMLAMTTKCKLPGRYPGQYKWPKLQEAYKWCFQKEFDKAHDALADVRACKEIFFHSVYQPEPTEASPANNPEYIQTA